MRGTQALYRVKTGCNLTAGLLTALHALNLGYGYVRVADAGLPSLLDLGKENDAGSLLPHLNYERLPGQHRRCKPDVDGLDDVTSRIGAQRVSGRTIAHPRPGVDSSGEMLHLTCCGITRPVWSGWCFTVSLSIATLQRLNMSKQQEGAARENRRIFKSFPVSRCISLVGWFGCAFLSPRCDLRFEAAYLEELGVCWAVAVHHGIAAHPKRAEPMQDRRL